MTNTVNKFGLVKKYLLFVYIANFIFVAIWSCSPLKIISEELLQLVVMLALILNLPLFFIKKQDEETDEWINQQKLMMKLIIGFILLVASLFYFSDAINEAYDRAKSFFAGNEAHKQGHEQVDARGRKGVLSDQIATYEDQQAQEHGETRSDNASITQAKKVSRVQDLGQNREELAEKISQNIIHNGKIKTEARELSLPIGNPTQAAVQNSIQTEESIRILDFMQPNTKQSGVTKTGAHKFSWAIGNPTQAEPSDTNKSSGLLGHNSLSSNEKERALSRSEKWNDFIQKSYLILLLIGFGSFLKSLLNFKLFKEMIQDNLNKSYFKYLFENEARILNFIEIAVCILFCFWSVAIQSLVIFLVALCYIPKLITNSNSLSNFHGMIGQSSLLAHVLEGAQKNKIKINKILDTIITALIFFFIFQMVS